MPNRIHQLDSQLANKIAAGEVIERPANACKELVENALDAGARRINIDIEEGGKKLLRVRDDGSGMSSGDAVLCLQRHATSKLQAADDLFAIKTLGFRGEAMPSIAAVSKFEMTTREHDAEAGTRIVVEGGEVVDMSEVGCSPGTEVTVRDLFWNVPARFKFLKSDAAESGRIAEMVGHLALANPEVAFRLRSNGNETLRVEANGNAFNAVVCVLGREAARQMLPIAPSSESATSPVKVTGFVSRPQMTKSNRNGQLFYVNGRVVKNRALQHAVAAAYEGLLHGKERFPSAILFIEVPPAAVDVNVHPAKSEVRFAREWEVHHAVRVAIRETLTASQLAPDWGLAPGPREGAFTAPFGAPLPASPSSPNGLRDVTTSRPATDAEPFGTGRYSQPVAPRGGNIEAFRGAQDEAAQQRAAFQSQLDAAQNRMPAAQISLPDLAPLPEEAPAKKSLRALAQITNNTYILCEGEDGLYIVCQHRAHERILADKTIAAAEGKPVERQRLVIPFTVEVGPRAQAAIDENMALLQDLGFEVEAFGGGSVLVRAVPAPVAKGDYETAFSDLLDELLSGQVGRNLQERRRQLLTMLACKNAIKAGDPLAPEAMTQLLDDLMELPNPSICPHGQPILIKISTLELDKKFEREYASR